VITIWDTVSASGRPLLGLRKPVRGLAFLPDGNAWSPDPGFAPRVVGAVVARDNGCGLSRRCDFVALLAKSVAR